jgi:hypothetical protein
MIFMRAFARVADTDLTVILIVQPGQSTVGNSRCCMALPSIQFLGLIAYGERNIAADAFAHEAHGAARCHAAGSRQRT